MTQSDDASGAAVGPEGAHATAPQLEPEASGDAGAPSAPAGSSSASPASAHLEERRAARAETLGRIARCLTLSALLGLSFVVLAQFTVRANWLTLFITENQLPMPQRMRMIYSMLGGLGAGALVSGVTMLVLRRKGVPLASLERVLWFLSPLILLPLLPQLFRWKPWKGKHTELLPVLLFVVLMAEVLFVRCLSNVPERVNRAWDWVAARLPGIWKKHGPLIVVLTAITAYAVFMSFYNLRWHYKIRTHNFDLAIDNNLIYGALEGAHMESTVALGHRAKEYIAAHAKFGQYVILPIYALFPKVETLIIIQAVFLGLAALPLFAFAKSFVRPWAATAIALAYLCYYPMHCANFTESKYLSLSCLFVMGTYWAVHAKRWVLFGLFFVCATMMREDVPVGMAIGGTFLLLSGHRPIAGLIMAVVSTGWFLILRFLIMDKAGEWWFPGMYKGMFAPGETGYTSVMKTLVTNPVFALGKVVTKDKVFYLLHLLVPLAFLPARRWYLWAAFVPGAMLTLLVTDYKPIISYSFQYVMHWVPYLFLAVPIAIAAIAKSSGGPRAHAALMALALSVTVSTYHYGAFSTREGSVRGGYHSINFTFSQAERERYAALKDVISVIPPKASVTATETLGPHVSSRRYLYAMRRGLYEAEYLLASSRELDFEQTRKVFVRAVQKGEYGVVKRSMDFAVLKRGHDTAGNQALIDEWKL